MTDKQIKEVFKNGFYCIEPCPEIKELQVELDQLKAENDDLKKYKYVVYKLAGMQVILTNENGVPQLYDNAKDLKLKQLSKTLTEIKELCQKHIKAEKIVMANDILQKISECEVE